jgi:hypothetical protein
MRMLDRGQLSLQHEIVAEGSAQWRRVQLWHAERNPAVAAKQETVPQTAAANYELPSSPPAAIQAQPVAMGDWYVTVNGESQGPVDENTIGTWIRAGRVTAESMVWRSGMEQWELASRTFPAVLQGASTGAQSSNAIEISIATNSDTSASAMKAFIDRRPWILAGCIMIYLFAIEALLGGVYLFYIAVALRRFAVSDASAVFSATLVFSGGFLLAAAFQMTKLLVSIDRFTISGSQQAANDAVLYEKRLWVIGVGLGAFILFVQAIMAIIFLIKIA